MDELKNLHENSEEEFSCAKAEGENFEEKFLNVETKDENFKERLLNIETKGENFKERLLNIETKGENPVQPAIDAELESELEEIKDMFQRELDAAANGEILIQELDEIEDESENDEGDDEDEKIPEEELCRCCGERRRSLERGEDYPYCENCRNLMLNNPLNAMGVIVTLIVLVIAGVACAFMVQNADSYSVLTDAQLSYEENKLSTALQEYLQYTNAVDISKSYSKKAFERSTELLANMGYFSYATQYIEKYFTEDELNKVSNKEIKAQYDYASKLLETQTYISEELGDDMNAGEFEKALKALDGVIKANSEGDEAGKYDEMYLKYTKFFLSSMNDADDESLVKMLVDMKDEDDEKFNGKYSWMYLTQLIKAYARLDDEKNANAVADEIKKINQEELTVYTSLSDLYRFRLSKDSTDEQKKEIAEKITDLAKQAEDHYDGSLSYPLYYRLYAISLLIEGSNDAALAQMTDYLQVSQGYMEQEDYQVYAIAAAAAGDSETYESISSSLAMQGYILPDEIEKFAGGKLTIAELLSSKEVL